MPDLAKQEKGNLNAVSSSALLTSFRVHLRAENRRPKTIEHYLSASQQFIDFIEAEGMPHITEVSREHVELWLESLQARMAQASVKNRYLGLRRFMDWLADEGEIERNPFGPPQARRIKPPAVDATSKDVVTPDEMSRVLAMLEKERRWRDLALVSILFDTGMRVGELVEMRAHDVDLDTGIIVIRITKSRKPRMVRIGPKTIRNLSRYWRRPRREPGYAINTTHGKLRRDTAYKIIRKVFAQAGIDKTVGPHDLRHTAASHMAGNVSEREMMTLFGWQDSSMAHRYTQQALEKIALAAHEKFSPMENL